MEALFAPGSRLPSPARATRHFRHLGARPSQLEAHLHKLLLKRPNPASNAGRGASPRDRASPIAFLARANAWRIRRLFRNGLHVAHEAFSRYRFRPIYRGRAFLIAAHAPISRDPCNTKPSVASTASG